MNIVTYTKRTEGMRNKQICRLARGNLDTMVVGGTGVLGESNEAECYKD